MAEEPGKEWKGKISIFKATLGVNQDVLYHAYKAWNSDNFFVIIRHY